MPSRKEKKTKVSFADQLIDPSEPPKPTISNDPEAPNYIEKIRSELWTTKQDETKALTDRRSDQLSPEEKLYNKALKEVNNLPKILAEIVNQRNLNPEEKSKILANLKSEIDIKQAIKEQEEALGKEKKLQSIFNLRESNAENEAKIYAIQAESINTFVALKEHPDNIDNQIKEQFAKLREEQEMLRESRNEKENIRENTKPNNLSENIVDKKIINNLAYAYKGSISNYADQKATNPKKLEEEGTNILFS